MGGKARTIARDGWLVEAGPGGFLGGRPDVDRLITSCGMDGERVTADAAAAHRFILIDGTMREVAPNPIALVRNGILGVGGVLRMLGEPFIKRRTGGGDESIWDFTARRLGPQVADRMIRPMTLGIYAGDARALSVEAAFPRMTALERDHGSIIRGMIAKRGRTTSGALTSFRRGMQSFPEAVAARGGFSVRLGAKVSAIVRMDQGWSVVVEGDREMIPADAVLIAAEPFAAAPLLRPLDAALAAELDAIKCPPVSVVGLGFGAAEAARVPNGFGALIARGEGLRALGNLWESRFYPGRSPQGSVLIRAMFGGGVDPDAGAMTRGRTGGARARGDRTRVRDHRRAGDAGDPALAARHPAVRTRPRAARGAHRARRGCDARIVHHGLRVARDRIRRRGRERRTLRGAGGGVAARLRCAVGTGASRGAALTHAPR